MCFFACALCISCCTNTDTPIEREPRVLESNKRRKKKRPKRLTHTKLTHKASRMNKKTNHQAQSKQQQQPETEWEKEKNEEKIVYVAIKISWMCVNWNSKWLNSDVWNILLVMFMKQPRRTTKTDQRKERERGKSEADERTKKNIHKNSSRSDFIYLFCYGFSVHCFFFRILSASNWEMLEWKKALHQVFFVVDGFVVYFSECSTWNLSRLSV